MKPAVAFGSILIFSLISFDCFLLPPLPLAMPSSLSLSLLFHKLCLSSPGSLTRLQKVFIFYFIFYLLFWDSFLMADDKYILKGFRFLEKLIIIYKVEVFFFFFEFVRRIWSEARDSGLHQKLSDKSWQSGMIWEFFCLRRNRFRCGEMKFSFKGRHSFHFNLKSYCYFRHVTDDKTRLTQL